MVHRSLGIKLQALRARQGLTLQEAAGRMGIGRDTLSYIEQGRRPATTTLAKIARGYGVPVEDFLEEPEPEAPPLSLALMMQTDDEVARQKALEDAAPGQVARYVRDLERAIISAGKQLVSPHHQLEGEQEGLTKYMQTLLDLREEVEPYTAHRVEQTHASVG